MPMMDDEEVIAPIEHAYYVIEGKWSRKQELEKNVVSSLEFKVFTQHFYRFLKKI